MRGFMQLPQLLPEPPPLLRRQTPELLEAPPEELTPLWRELLPPPPPLAEHCSLFFR